MSFGKVSEQDTRKEENSDGLYQILDLCYRQKLVPVLDVPAESFAYSALEGCFILGSNVTQTVSNQTTYYTTLKLSELCFRTYMLIAMSYNLG